jgi:predicted nucleic acid-binding protein
MPRSAPDARGGATLDAGALIAFERGQRNVVALVARAIERDAVLAVPAGVVAQIWRDGARQARLTRLLAASIIDIVPLDDHAARAAGQLLGASGTTDVVDASAVWCARERGHAVVTADVEDMRVIDPSVPTVRC